MIYLYFIFLFLNCILYIYRQLQFTIMRRVLQRVNVIVPSDWPNYFLREIWLNGMKADRSSMITFSIL